MKYISGAWYYVLRECDKGEWSLAIYLKDGFYILLGQTPYPIDDVYYVGIKI